MRLSNLYSLFSLIITIQLSAQNITGKVIDIDNSIELSNVQIINSINNNIILTDINGFFTLLRSDTYVFSKNGYFSKIIDISNTKFIIVELQTKPENLDEIKITSSSYLKADS